MDGSPLETKSQSEISHETENKPPIRLSPVPAAFVRAFEGILGELSEFRNNNPEGVNPIGSSEKKVRNTDQGKPQKTLVVAAKRTRSPAPLVERDQNQRKRSASKTT